MTPLKPAILVTPRGTLWPSGQSKPLATLAVNDEWVASIVGTPLISDVEPGLGPWIGIGGTLPSGICIELLRYELGDGLYELHSDSSANTQAVLEEFLRVTGLAVAVVRWQQTEI